MKMRWVLALLGCAFSGAEAADVWHTSTLKRVYPRADGSFILNFHTDSPSCTNVNTPKYYIVDVGRNGMTAEGSQKIYAAALLAIATGKQVSVSFDDGSAVCYVHRMMLLD